MGHSFIPLSLGFGHWSLSGAVVPRRPHPSVWPLNIIAGKLSIGQDNGKDNEYWNYGN
jgi:hypothetical protein